MAQYEKRENGTWSVRFTIQQDDKFIKKRLSGFKTKREAIQAYDAFMDDFRIHPEKIATATFGDVFADWMAYLRKRSKSSTIYSYESAYDSVLAKQFEKVKLNEITPLSLKNWQDSLDFSYKYTQKLRSIISCVFKYAQRYYNYPLNPVEKVEPIRRTVPKKEIAVWEIEHFNHFINYVDDNLYRAFFIFLYYTGCRKAEALALNWSDIDFQKRTVSISKTYTRKVRGAVYKIESTPKTSSSIRTIKLPTNVIEALKTLDFDTKFVFGDEDPIPERTLANRFSKYYALARVEMENLPRITFHGFRHSHASLLISKGMSIVAVSKRLGHTSIDETLKTYSHLMKNDEESLIFTLENL